jgi:hypothetical protein
MPMFVVLLTVLSVAVACVALPYVERDEESELSQVSQSLVTSKGDRIIVLLKSVFWCYFCCLLSVGELSVNLKRIACYVQLRGG